MTPSHKKFRNARFGFVRKLAGETDFCGNPAFAFFGALAVSVHPVKLIKHPVG